MTLNIIEEHEARLAERISELEPSRRATADEFDAIAKYLIVADELSHEPFMSEDNHEGLVLFGPESTTHAKFGHPAFLKSAILPFRKLWMKDEPCRFETVRDLIFDLFGELDRPTDFRTPQVNSYRSFFGEFHERALNRQIDAGLATAKVRTVRDIIDIWIYTHGVHTGKTKRKGRFDLKDFDDVLEQSGRVLFESKFRTSLYLIGHNSYLGLNRILVRPIFARLVQLGNKPRFETRAALKFGPYPKQTDRILLDDPFWHLDKESEEETFDRLIRRYRFSGFGTFFSGYFLARRPALEALKIYESLDVLLQSTGAVILDAASPDLTLNSSFSARGDMNNNGGAVNVYTGKAVHFADHSRAFMNRDYRHLREAFLAHRQSIPKRADNWDRNWWGS